MNSITKIAILLIFSGIIPVNAQVRNKKATNKLYDTDNKIVTNYVDSLTQFRSKQDSTYKKIGKESKTYNTLSTFAPLFIPTTYYREITHNSFSLDDYYDTDNLLSSSINKSLMSVYLNRPDLVRFIDKDVLAANILSPNSINDLKTLPAVTDKADITPQEDGPATIDVVVKKPNFWTFTGDYYLQFLQNYVSENWYKGGESNYSMVASAIIQANYNNKQKVKWDNKLELKLGFQTSKGDSIHRFKTSEDLIRYTSKFGLQASKKWYYTLQLIASTQFMRGFKNNDPKIYSSFIAPLNVNLSIGMDYNVLFFKERLKGTIHMAPVAYNFKYVQRPELAERYGLKPFHRTLHDIGSEFTADLTWILSDMIKWRTRLYGYTTYKRAELEWENTLSFQFNKFISTNIFLYPRFDDARGRDSKHGYWEFKEYASIGFAYSF
ncbi:DUF3078 domain-containing protein [Hoylesella nanceiensis]|jgi:hypothetical protein|uniref:DUF3078 domain-containing protein n=1 Tax=Hoylesella nanceiensis TaxID=425941 RepID=UPI00037CF907|nr:DUF3078 domain-containing protein [Hoylesella nanceiensis]